MKLPPLFLLLFVTLSAQAQPWQPNVIWHRQGLGDSSLYGVRVFALGDQNDDGFDDWAVSSYNDRGTADLGYVEFFHGGTNPSQQPYMTIHQSSDDLFFMGGSPEFSPWGDINGDGYIDWPIWRRYASSSDFYRFEVYFGGPEADTLPDVVLTAPYRSNTQLVYFDGIGDFNGDGFDDVYRYDFRDDFVQIFFGGVPFDTIPDWVRHSPPEAPQQSLPFGFGDVNGDGSDDWVSMRSGSATDIIDGFWGGAQPDTLPDLQLGTSQYPRYWPVNIVNDLNNKGKDDIVCTGTDAVQINYGGDSIPQQPDIVLPNPCAGGKFVSAGNFNGDLFKDFLVVDFSCPSEPYGLVGIYLGGWESPSLCCVVTSTSTGYDLFRIFTAAGIGDVNGDGADDILIGAWDDLIHAGWRGQAIIVAGDTSLHVAADDFRPELPSDLQVGVFPNPFNSTTSLSFTLPSPERVDITLCDILGRRVQTLASRPFTPGKHTLTISGDNLSTGIYFVHLQAGQTRRVEKILLLR